MTTRSSRRVSPQTPTLEQALIRLLLYAGPVLLVYLLGLGLLVAVAQDCWRLLVLIAGTLILLGLLRGFASWLIEVPFLQAEVLTQRNNLRLEAVLKGFYVRPAFLYNRLARVSLRPSEGELVMKNVALRDGPPLTLRAVYTLRPVLPPGANVLPRTHAGEAAQAQDQRMLGYLFLGHNQPERWQQVSGNAIEGALRTFLNGLRVDDLYGPQGAALDTREVRERADAYLATTVEPDLGFNVHVHTLAVLGGDNTGMLAWHQRWMQLQRLREFAANLTPDQALVMGELFQQLAGNGGHGGLDPALLYLFRSQMGYNGDSGVQPPGPQAGPRGWPPEPPPPRGWPDWPAGPDRPAA